MALQQVQPARIQFLDANGVPLVGGTVGTYIPGTLTPTTTYQDPYGSAQNDNPLTLDSLGSCAIWNATLVRMIVKDADGNQLYDEVGGNIAIGTSPKQYGAVGNGVADDSAAVASAINVGGIIDLSGASYYIGTSKSFTGKRFQLAGDCGTNLVFGAGVQFNFTSCDDSQMQNVGVKGAITSDTQFTSAITGSAIATAFGAPTYNNGTAPVDGIDFTHTLSGTSLTVSLLALSGLQTRNVVSDFITLDATKRYVVDIEPGFITGNGANLPVFEMFDGGGSSLGYYDPQDTSSYAGIVGASSIKVSLGANRSARTTTGLSCVYDLTKMVFYQLINDLATVSLASSPGDTGPLKFVNSNRVKIYQNRFFRIGYACLKLDTCNYCDIKNNDFSYSYQGITSDNGIGNEISNNRFDLRFKVTAGLGYGGYLGNRFWRLHAVSGVNDDQTIIQDNYIQGPSWAIEMLPRDAASYHTIKGNVIYAEMCGVSSAGGGGVNEICENQITLSCSGFMGVEAAGETTGWRGDINGNTIRWMDVVWRGFGISASKVTSVSMKYNTIYADIGCQSTDASNGGNIEFSYNKVYFGFCAFLGQALTHNITKNDMRIVRSLNNYGNLVSTTVAVQPSDLGAYSQICGNDMDETTALAINVISCGNLVVSDNIIFANTNYATKYADIEIDVPTATPTFTRFLRNTIYGSISTNWCAFVNSIYSGSEFFFKGNVVNDAANDYPANVPASMLMGCEVLYGFSVNVTPGLIAAGGTYALAGITVGGVIVGDTINATCLLAAGDPAGISAKAVVTADNTASLFISNTSTAGITPGIASWRLEGRKT